MRRNVPLDFLCDVIFPQESQSIRDAPATVELWVFNSARISLPNRVILRRMWDSCQGTASNVSFKKGIKRETDPAWKNTHAYSTFIVKMCVLIRLPDLLNSRRLCLQIILCNKGNQNRASFSVQCFFFLPPRQIKLPPAEQRDPPKHQDSPPLCSAP